VRDRAAVVVVAARRRHARGNRVDGADDGGVRETSADAAREAKVTTKKPISDKKRAWLYKAAVDLADALRSGEVLPDDLHPETVEKLRALFAAPRSSVVHDLKCWPNAFRAIVDGRKCFEIRKNDRDFRPGDRLVLNEWDPGTGQYISEPIEVDVTYMVFGGQWGLPDNLCVMSLGPVSRRSAR
jgi:hypothetical protein